MFQVNSGFPKLSKIMHFLKMQYSMLYINSSSEHLLH